MIRMIFLLNYAAVGLFGSILSAAFCPIRWTKRNKILFSAVLLSIGIIQGSLYLVFPIKTLRELYPLITHLPLMILLYFLTGKRFWSIGAVLTAYLCCQLRRWIALLIVALFHGMELMQATAELAVTVPLLLLLLWLVAPGVREMSQYSKDVQALFSLIPAVAYAFDYITRIYTNWLVQGVPAAVEFMPFVCSAAFLLFSLYTVRSLRRQSELEQSQAIMDMQVRQSALRIGAMKQSQELAAQYRHDLHHHLQYLSACLDRGDTATAQDYISDLNDQIVSNRVATYCEHTAANLILGAFAQRAAEAGITMTVRMSLGPFPRVSDIDLCVLLSNALENALHACQSLKQQGKEAFLSVQGYEKDTKLFFQIINSCGPEIAFKDGLPVSHRQGHGIGVQSICTIAEKYGGLYTFEARDEKFILRLSL